MKRFLFCSALTSIVLAGCASAPPNPSVSAEMMPTKGNTTAGIVTFTQKDGKVWVSGEIKGLKPNAEHGFHVHEKGDCSSGDGLSAGGHFNPNGMAHGAHHDATHHVGDLQSLKADANGVARFNFAADAASITGGVADVRGRGLIVHRDPDDYKTQPTGNSGPRLACGVIGK